jgi:dolichol-phosphate mannosyltransferase
VASDREDVWVVIPTFNEAENLEAIVAAIRERLPEAQRILIVDDDSPDGTGAIADRLAREVDEVDVLHRGVKEGIGPAYLSGFALALEQGAQRVIQMDADFSHDPADLPRLLQAAQTAELVIGSRYVSGGGVADWGALRRFISKGGSTYARGILRVPVRDLTGGFKCWRREALEAVDFNSVVSKGYAFQIEMTYRAIRAGCSTAEVPIVFRDRQLGNSKMSRAIVFEAIWQVPLLRARVRRT